MTQADRMTPRTNNERTVLSFYTLIMQKRFDEWAELFTENARQENPFMPTLPGLDSEFVGRNRIAFHYRTALSNRRDHIFDIDHIHASEDGRHIIVEVRGNSTVSETGRPYNQRYVMVFQLEGGKIAALREYFNPLVFQNAFDGFLVGEGAVAN